MFTDPAPDAGDPSDGSIAQDPPATETSIPSAPSTPFLGTQPVPDTHMELDALDPPAPSLVDEEMPVDPPAPSTSPAKFKARPVRFVIDFIEVPLLPPSLTTSYARSQLSKNTSVLFASGSGSGATVTIPAPSQRPKTTRTFPVMDEDIWRKAYLHKDAEFQRLAKSQPDANKVRPICIFIDAV